MLSRCGSCGLPAKSAGPLACSLADGGGARRPEVHIIASDDQGAAVAEGRGRGVVALAREAADGLEATRRSEDLDGARAAGDDYVAAGQQGERAAQLEARPGHLPGGGEATRPRIVDLGA